MPVQRPYTWTLVAPPVITAILIVVAGVFAETPYSPLEWAKMIAEREYVKMNEPALTLTFAIMVFAWPLLNALAMAFPSLQPAAWRVSALAALPALAFALTTQPGFSYGPFQLDETGRIFLGFSAALWLVSGWYAVRCLHRETNRIRFDVFFLLSMAGNFLLILAADIPTFYAGFALMGIASAGLVVHQGNPDAIRAGKLYLILAIVGEILLFVGLGHLAADSGSLRIESVVSAEEPLLAIILLLVGFGIKAGALCLHFWLPLAHPSAPVPASAVLSGAMIKAGVFRLDPILATRPARVEQPRARPHRDGIDRIFVRHRCGDHAVKRKDGPRLFQPEPDRYHVSRCGSSICVSRGLAFTAGSFARLRGSPWSRQRSSLSRHPSRQTRQQYLETLADSFRTPTTSSSTGRSTVLKRRRGQTRLEGTHPVSPGLLLASRWCAPSVGSHWYHLAHDSIPDLDLAEIGGSR